MNARMEDHHSVAAPEGRDIAKHMKDARDEIVWDVMNHGQYPAKGSGEIHLSDFLLDEFYKDDPAQMVKDLQAAVLGESFDHTIRYQWEARLEAYLGDSEIVQDRAAELEQQAREDAE